MIFGHLRRLSSQFLKNLTQHKRFVIAVPKSFKMKIPVAAQKDYNFTIHDTTITDEYAWMRDPKWPGEISKEIIDYLVEENNFTESYFTPFKDEKEKLFEELKGRIKLDDETVFIKKDDYFYYSRTECDKEYSIRCRKHKSLTAPEEVILDENVLAANHKFTHVYTTEPSPDHKLLACTIDFSGDEKYTIHITDLETQKNLPDEVSNTSGYVAWHQDLNGFFYLPLNEYHRTDKIMFHKLGTKIADDKLVFKIENQERWLSLKKSGSKEFIFININGHDSNEIHFMKMNDPDFKTQLIRAKKNEIFYSVEHNGSHFYIHTNEGAKNFRIVTVETENVENDLWKTEFVPEDDRYLSNFAMTKDYIIFNYRKEGLPVIEVKSLKEKSKKMINFPDASYVASAKTTNYMENDIRIDYSSLAQPQTTYSYDFSTGGLKILKIQEIPTGLDSKDYTVERVWINNEDVKLPITIFYKNSVFKKDGSLPLYLYGYGSYGNPNRVNFSNKMISIANRGFVCAFPHIRGGDDLGHEWYKAAKLLTKKKTFEDFIASAEGLIEMKYTSKGNIVCAGGSAGGMLVGVTINERPELFKAAVMHVPFVDVLNTMLDETLPLTPGEFNEWGNPKDSKYFDYIMSYSPYDNIRPQKYPNIFVTAGLYDSRVTYWEASKLVAKLRRIKTDDNVILLKTDMNSGHSGLSGRFHYLKEIADELVFVMSVFGKIKSD